MSRRCFEFLISFVLVILVSGVARAATSAVSLSNYFPTKSQDSSGIWHVYSGKTGSGCTGSDNNNTCSTCALSAASTFNGKATFACNDSEIFPSLYFAIQLKSDVAATYLNPVCSLPIIATYQVSGTNSSTWTTEVEVSYNATGANVANQVVTGYFSWANICRYLGNNADCKTSFDGTIEFSFVSSCAGVTKKEDGAKVHFHHRWVQDSPPMTFTSGTACNGNSANRYENVCDFQIMRGDEKAYVVNLLANNASNFVVPDLTSGPIYATAADASNMKYGFLKLYYSTNPFATMTIGGAGTSSAMLSLTGIDLNDSRIDGLTNGAKYYFVAANVDQGGNQTHFSLPGAPIFLSTDGAAGTGPVIALSDSTPTVPAQTAQPEPVSGLLDGQKCFVATAAYGSELAPQVESLRQFRNRHLLNSALGRGFVRLYYQHSPTWAQRIAASDELRWMSRVMLAPILVATEAIVGWNLEPLLGQILFFGILILGALGLCGALVIVLRRRFRSVFST